jgi:uncharacterized membrane-anchored protein YjiN (DUF445 family)
MIIVDFDGIPYVVKEIVKQNSKGAGRKNKYKEKTTTIAFRCPESKKEEVTNMIKDKLKEWEV